MIKNSALVFLCLVTLGIDSRAATAAQLEKNATPPAGESLENKLTGFGFAPGLAAIYMTGDVAIESATVGTDGRLLVKEKSRVRLGGIFETHFLFGAGQKDDGTYKNKKLQAAIVRARSGEESTVNDALVGPIVAVELGENLVRSAGAGVVIALRRYNVRRKSSTDPVIEINPVGLSFNLGFMAIVEANVNTLGNGLKKGDVVAVGTPVQLDQKERFGGAIIFSTKW